MNYVKLTEHPSGHVIWVNLDNSVRMEWGSGFTTIRLDRSSGHELVKETPEEILALIGEPSCPQLDAICEYLSRIENHTENTYYAVR